MKKIMVVEDSNLMISVIRNFVKKRMPDIELIEVHNGREAVERYPIDHPDLVFMDIMMPEMDGLTAMQRILEMDRSAKIIMVTSLKDTPQRQRALGMGAKMYITKPFSSSDIFQALEL